MLLTKVILKDYGVYRGETVFDLESTNDKPIILIGGTNGAGKTSLFESIMLCLYGISSFDKKTTRKTYEKFLANKIHRYLGTPVSADHSSIIVQFRFYHNGKVTEYRVNRSWLKDDGKVIEDLKIEARDSDREKFKPLEKIDESQWQSFIEELIPRGIAKLFFFDGEKIVRMAEEGNEDIEIKSSFDSLLGIDLVEQLHSDLRVHILRNMKDDSKRLLEEHDRMLKEKEEIQSDIEHLQEKKRQKEEELENTTKESEELEKQISKVGGGYATKREQFQAKKSSLEIQKNNIQNNLRNILAGPTPFAIIPVLLNEVKSQVERDNKILGELQASDIISGKFEKIKTKIKNDKSFESLDSKSKTRLIQQLKKELQLGHPKLKPLFDMSQSESSFILHLIDSIDSEVLSHLTRETESYTETVDELEKIEIGLANAPKDDEIGPIISKLQEVHSSIGMLETEIRHLEQQISSKQSYIKMLNVKMRNIISDQYKDKNAKTQVELAKKVQNVLDDYVERLKEKKLKLLEEYLLDAIHTLMHKEEFIDKVSVDRETFEITLYRNDENEIPKDLLSKGEQQMFATSVLMALAKTSGKSLPFMIDTPLARLDVAHRDNLVELFFPYASHQVIIFSTDSEIDEKFYPRLQPFINRSYTMQYLHKEGKTKQHEGYFWNEKGEKVIAV